MPLFIVRQDITKMSVDAIVNAANNTLLGGGGVDGAIHRVAGPELTYECSKLNGCLTGDAKITDAFNLPCKKVIHTVGPIWKGGQFDEEALLTSCYNKSLMLAKENNLKSVAFPLISTGAYGYPKEKALKVATDTIKNFLLNEDMTVYIVVYDNESFAISKKQFNEVKEYIDNIYIIERRNRSLRYRDLQEFDETYDPNPSRLIKKSDYYNKPNLNDELKNLDETFSEMLFRILDEKKMSEVECYKKANINRRVFSKLRDRKNYKPSKRTAIAFAIALKLTLDETKKLLSLAGYSLAHNNEFDIIIEFFIKTKKYDIFDINATLFYFGQDVLGEE